MSLIGELESKDKNGLFKSNDNIVCYPTGITVLDYANGYWTEVMGPDGEMIHVPNIGIPGGSLVSIIGSTGNGKSVPNSTMLPTPNGLRRADEIQVGDYLFDRLGKKTKVLGIYPQEGLLDTYEITFQDGRTARCSKDHLWTVLYASKQTVKTKTTAELIEDFERLQPTGERVLHVHPYSTPINGAVEYEKREIYVDPWVLGVFIGNGTFLESALKLSSGTSEIPERVAEIMGWTWRRLSPTESDYYYIFYHPETGSRVKCAEFLEHYPELIKKYSYEKHIPNDYLYNTIEIRRRFLAGLLDTDGWITEKKRRIGFTTTSPTLKDDVVNLARSLGYFAYVVEDPRSEKYTTGVCYTITISCPDEDKQKLFYCGEKARKAREATASYNTRRNYDHLTIIDIQKVGQDDMRCFIVDNEEHLFLTENYVVTHNSTFAEQIGWNIVKGFDDGLLFIVDCEKSAERERICNILGCPRDEPRLIIDKQKSSIDDVLESFDLLCKTKEAGGKKYMYEVHNRTFNGDTFWTYVPTVYIIDSLPKFNCRDFNDKDLGGNVDSMRGARDVTRFYTNVVDRAWQFNVIFIVINHIRPNLVMNPYASPPRGLMMINPQSETLPRGSVAQYYSSVYFRINSKKSAAYTLADDGFTGFKCDIQLAKSRTNVVGSSFPVTFNSDRGFDPIYSMYEFANSLGLISGRNPYLVLQGFEERKFNRKEFVTLMTVDENFRNGVLTVLRPYYESLLSSKKEKVAEVKEVPDLDLVVNYYG